MSPRSLVLAGRTLVATLLADTGTITRGGVPVFDPVTGSYTPASGTVIHEGPCRVRMQARTSGDLDIFGDTAVTTTRFVITFPHDIPNVLIDDVVTVSESDDPHIGLRSFRVIAVPSLTFLMYRELGCEVIEA
jgi:hypothetical protein